MNAELSAVTHRTRLEALSTATVIVGEVGDDLVDHRDFGETARKSNPGTGVGDLVVGGCAHPAQVGDEVLGAEVASADRVVSKKGPGVSDAEDGLDPTNDRHVESVVGEPCSERVEAGDGLDLGYDDAGEPLGRKAVEILVVPRRRVVVDANQDRELSGQVGDRRAHLGTTGVLGIRWSGILQVDHDCIGAGARHLAQEVGPDGRGEQQRAETTREHAGTLRADLAA